MQEQNELTGEQSLMLIESMINRAKNNFNENGHLYLIWGWTVFICSLTQFVLLKWVKYDKHYLVWSITLLVFLYQFYFLIRKRRDRQVRTYTDHIIGFVWIAFVISLLIMIFIILRGQESRFNLLNPLFLALYGIPTFLSGIIIRFKPLLAGGISCWIFSIAATFLPYEYQVLILSAAMLFAWIIPGYLLQAKFSKLNP